MGPRGIRAIQVICDDSSRSSWFGRPEGSPITERLVRTEHIAALEVEFHVSSRAPSLIRRICTNCFLLQGYKLVSFSVAEATKLLERLPEERNLSLRDGALWYPNVPGVGLDLKRHHLQENSCPLLDTGLWPGSYLEGRKYLAPVLDSSLRPLRCGGDIRH